MNRTVDVKRQSPFALEQQHHRMAININPNLYASLHSLSFLTSHQHCDQRQERIMTQWQSSHSVMESVDLPC